MENRWTDEQNSAINLHNRNLLVSAAAGSGKTAVLVERIIRMITGENAMDVDSLLVLTFTRAAASEMKERIALRLNEMLTEGEGDSGKLQRQLALLNHASITTIDSFCLRVVRDYFGELDLDPDFRVADEGEKTLLEADCMEELLEACYEEGAPDFLDFAESYGGKKNDGNLTEYITKLYKFSQSDPYPEEWLSHAADAFSAETMDEIEKLEPVVYLTDCYKTILADILPLAEELHEICLEPDGPDVYESMCRSDLEQLRSILSAKNLAELCEQLSLYKPERKSSKKMPQADPVKKEYVSKTRDVIKKAIQDQQKKMAKIDPAFIADTVKKMRAPMNVLVRLTIAYSNRVAQAKADKNILDFSDLEHMALKILLNEEKQPTAAAKELQKQYAEILVDEYQDSNYLQDTILDAISRRRDGKPNMFMVGDVKQSIYRFRMARPEIFMDRYDTYSEEESLYQKINLTKNFRSRKEVLEGINLIFRRIMTRGLGDVAYDRAAELNPGAKFDEPDQDHVDLKIQSDHDRSVFPPMGAHYITDNAHKALKLTLVDVSPEKNEAFLAAHADGMSVDGLTAQAQAVAEEIKRLTDPDTGMLVLDKKTGIYRNASYKDITILLRSVTGKSDTFLEVLSARGIPVCADAKGYFSALEIKTVLSYLQIIDNPYQDIPLAAVMKSAIWDFGAEELAQIRAFYQKAGKEADPRFYSAMKYYCRHHRQEEEQQEEGTEQEKADEKKYVPSDSIRLHLMQFMEKLDGYRRCAVYMPVQELIQYLLKDTGFYDYVSAMPAGIVRKRNLDMLVEKAIRFEKTSYHGLYQFVRYIDHLEKFEVDFEQGQMFGEQDDIVRIMSIHKSKGLEFPIVILADMSKSFNMMDANAGIISHADFGLAADYIDTERRCKIRTILSTALRQKIKNDTLGEELRLLYVAMTRAKEALIMVGAVKDTDKLLDTYASENPSAGALSYQKLSGVSDYLSWVLMAAGEKLEDWMEISLPTLEEVFMGSVQNEIETAYEMDEILQLAASGEGVVKDKTWDRLEELQDFQYAFSQSCEIQSKFSVSELKHKAMKDKNIEFSEQGNRYSDLEKAGEALKQEVPETEEKKALSDKDGKPLTGADRGTAYHNLLELLNPAESISLEGIEAGIGELITRNKIQKEHAALVNPKKLLRYYRSSIGERFIEAYKAGKLYREREFIMNIPAREANAEWDSEEPVLIQGIIDVYWEEPDGLVLLDYKTDSKGVTEEKNLIDRYLRQFELYDQALSQILRKPVKERYIWSFHLDKAIKL